MSAWPGKFVIGLTGNIATGKSVVRKMLEHLGAYGIDADALGLRVDLHRDDVLRVESQGVGDVVPRPGPDDQNVAERLAAAVAAQQVDQRVGGAA